MRIGCAGGGTGGHVFPIQSLIKYIHTTHPSAHTFFWFGEKKSLEEATCETLHKKISGLSFVSITSSKRRREKEFFALMKNMGGLVLLLRGLLVSLYHIKKLRIDVVFCKGGFVSLPVVVAARVWKKRVLLHESDTKAGLSNRICARFADTIFTGFPGVFPGKEIVVGQILDDDLLQYAGITYNQEAKAEGETHVLVVGGSQGSHTLYETLLRIIKNNDHDVAHMHFHVILGTLNQGWEDQFAGLADVTSYRFVDQDTMGQLLALCDLSITRGGTTSLAEQDLFGLKKIIIPIPWTHDQRKNAEYYRDHNGDILILQDTDTYETDLTQIIQEHKNYKKSPLGGIKARGDAKKTITKALLG